MKKIEEERQNINDEYTNIKPVKILSDEEENQLKNLYRKLSRIYHPDLSGDEKMM